MTGKMVGLTSVSPAKKEWSFIASKAPPTMLDFVSNKKKKFQTNKQKF